VPNSERAAKLGKCIHFRNHPPGCGINQPITSPQIHACLPVNPPRNEAACVGILPRLSYICKKGHDMGAIKKGSKIRSIFGFKCPKCQEGDLFPTPTFSFRQPFNMPERCPRCGQSYMPEPGFYYGAMFISYIISGWFSIIFVLFLHWVLDWSILASFSLLIAISAFFFVYVFRLSRSIWINLMVKYDPKPTE
jgi:uncharacterized protein (DUF983 family)